MHLLFYKEGFSHCVLTENGSTSKPNHFKVSHFSQWEEEICKELELNLSLRRNFEIVHAGFVSSFFNLVPESFLTNSKDVLLNFSEAEFEENVLLESATAFESSFIYGTSQKVVSKLQDLFGEVNLSHSGSIFLNSIEKSDDRSIHLNLIQNNLEIAVFNSTKIQFYNLFETPSDEDILFFTLFALEQVGLDANKLTLKTYGQLLPETKVFQTLKKYVRFVNTAMKDENFMENYTLNNLSKCELSPDHLKEKK